MLGACLRSIAALRFPEEVETLVLVVDNGADGAGRSVVEGLRGDYPVALHCIEEPRRGISMARNCALDGAQERGADYVGFLDDDEEPHPQWLEQLWLTRHRFDAGIVTGPVVPVNAEDPLPAGPSDAAKRSTGETPRFVSCNNVLFAAAPVSAAGLRFDPFFNFIGGEDFDFFERLRNHGVSCVWCAEAVVFERVPPERRTLRYLAYRHYTGGINAVLKTRRRRGAGQAWLRLLPKSLGKLCSGLAVMVPGLLGCRKCRSDGVKRIAVGLGYLSALFGVVVERYRSTDGS